MTRAIVIVFLSVFGVTASFGAELNIPSGVYAVDKGHTYVTFSYLHQQLSYPLLRAIDVDGELTLDADDVGASRVAIAVAADSIRSNVDYFDEELASPKFFNAGRFPHITYVAERMSLSAEGDGVLEGEVTIRGISRPLKFDVRINGAMTNPITEKPVVGVSATGVLNRSDFELDRFIPAVSDEVSIRIEAEFALGSNTGSAHAASLALGVTADD
ncbi:MAG: YceI family protein [Pseudomonadota bacterium]